MGWSAVSLCSRGLASHECARCACQNCSFREEGRLNSRAFRLGRWDDVIVTGLVCEDFEVVNPIVRGMDPSP